MSDHTTTLSVREDAPERAPELVPQLVVALESGRPHVASTRHLLTDLDRVVIGRGDRGVRRDAAAKRLEIKVPDRAMSTDHARLVRLRERWVLEDAGAKNGVWVNAAQVKRAVLLDGDLIEMGGTMFLYRNARAASPSIPDLSAPEGRLTTFSAELADGYEAALRAAPSLLPVVLVGESGTGKEVAARAVHAASGRPGAFVPVNCGALPEALVESVLFGHRRGAFSGAVEDRPGLVRAADRGTLFLDEIADLPAPAQVSLLRALQEREVLPIGETKAQKVDVRIIAAAQRPLSQLVEEGKFRADLLARLGGVVLRLPPLRERLCDLGILVSALLPQGRTLTGPASRTLFGYGWPLNVRELEKALAVASVMAGSAPIKREHLPDGMRTDLESTDGGEATDERLRAELVTLLGEQRGNVAEVARIMGKGRTQVQRWIKRFALELDTFRK